MLNIKRIVFTTSLLTVTAVFTTLVVGLATTANGVTTSVTAHSSTKAQRAEQVDDETPSNIKVVLLALRSDGFEPTEIQLAAGEYMLVIRNRTGLADVNVRLQREAGERLGQATVGSKQRDWKRRTTLTPGVYLLTESDHPDWICRIVVD